MQRDPFGFALIVCVRLCVFGRAWFAGYLTNLLVVGSIPSAERGRQRWVVAHSAGLKLLLLLLVSLQAASLARAACYKAPVVSIQIISASQDRSGSVRRRGAGPASRPERPPPRKNTGETQQQKLSLQRQRGIITSKIHERDGLYTYPVWIKRPKTKDGNGKTNLATIQKDAEGFWTPF